jgi:hypothetical protein
VSIQRLKNADGSFLLSKTLTDKGTHTFTVPQTSGNVQVTSSDPVEVYLGDGTTTLASNSGTNFTVGAVDFTQVAISTQTAENSVAMRLIPSQASSASSQPSWLDQTGYILGGLPGSSSVTKYNAVAESWSLGPTMPVNMYYHASVSDKGNAGYVGKGSIGGVAYNDDVYKLAYPTETWSSLAASSTAWDSTDRSSSFWSRNVAGYTACGRNSSVHVSSIDKVLYSTETFTRLGVAAANGRYQRAYWHHTTNNTGYQNGGRTVSTAPAAGLEQFDMTTETSAYLGSGWSEEFASAIVDDGVAAYFAYDTRTIQSFAYGSITLSTIARTGALVQRPCGISFDDHGVWHGGLNSSYQNYVQKMDYTTRTLSFISNVAATGTIDDGFGHAHYYAQGLWDV